MTLPQIVWDNDALQQITDPIDQRQISRVGVEAPSPDFFS